MLATSGDTFWTQWKSKKKSQGFLPEAFLDCSMFTGDSTRLESKRLLLVAWRDWDPVVPDSTIFPRLIEARTRRTAQEWFGFDLAKMELGWQACQY
jgi:hypothetical protein